MGIARIVNGTLAANQRSIALMKRLGFVVQRNLGPDLTRDGVDVQAVVGILENRRLLSSKNVPAAYRGIDPVAYERNQCNKN